MNFLLDTNFLLIPGQFRVDIFGQLQEFAKPNICTLDLVVKEIQQLAKGSSKASRYSRVALELIEKNGIEIIKAKSSLADESLLAAAKEGFVVCTQDIRLRKRLKAAGHKVVSMTGKRTLEMV